MRGTCSPTEPGARPNRRTRRVAVERSPNQPLHVAVLHPGGLDPDLLPQVSGGRSVTLLVGRYVDEPAARIAKATGAPDDDIRPLEAPVDSQTTRALRVAEVAVAADLPLDVLRLAPQLRWVQAYGAGVGQLVRVLRGSDVALTSAAGVSAESVAEFVFARLLQVRRRLREIDSQQIKHHWQSIHTESLAGATMVVIGLGAIGRRVARFADMFGMQVIAVRRRTDLPNPDMPEMRVVGRERLLEVLPAADVVVIAAAETADTSGSLGVRPLIGAAQLAAMRSGTSSSTLRGLVARRSCAHRSGYVWTPRRGDSGCHS